MPPRMDPLSKTATGQPESAQSRLGCVIATWGHGALAVRNVPSPQEALGSLMDGLMRMVNQSDEVPHLIKAALVGFGFVYLSRSSTAPASYCTCWPSTASTTTRPCPR